MEKIIRQHLTFTGEVQGVGFRYRAVHAAQLLEITGWVENEPDGSVEMEVQGTYEHIYQMIHMIGNGTYVDISRIRRREVPTEENEYGFHVHGY